MKYTIRDLLISKFNDSYKSFFIAVNSFIMNQYGDNIEIIKTLQCEIKRN